ncbi:hypothetical protein [Bdellovibrio bacteriovorus]|uniref:hypothetical protein n=1 Tax=Bdellovibrio bacteriovorus TaxID=959 RepID=UPI0035A69F8A
MISWLIAFKSVLDEQHTVYSLNEVREKFEVVQLTTDGYLVLNWDKEMFWLRFAVLDFHTGFDDDTFLSIVFHGEGWVGKLRECRHTWWGDAGYLFYPNGVLIGKALAELSKYFDGLDEKEEGKS